MQCCIHFWVTSTKERDQGDKVGRPKEAALEIHRRRVTPPLCRVTGIKATYFDVNWISHLTQPLDSPRIPQTFIPTICVGVNFSFFPIPPICYSLGFLALYYWKISYFSILVKVDDIWFVERGFCGFCLTTN